MKLFGSNSPEKRSNGCAALKMICRLNSAANEMRIEENISPSSEVL
jgi:hypothetical protein